MSTKVKLFLLTAVGVVLPLLANYLINTVGVVINPYLMMGMMVICLLLHPVLSLTVSAVNTVSVP